MISNLVLQEAAAGDPIPLRGARGLAHRKRGFAEDLKGGRAPYRSGDGQYTDFIATWNFAHLVGPVVKFRVQRILLELGFPPPILATPEELLETL